MRFEVVLTADAEQDLEDINDHVATCDSPQNADYVLDRLLKVSENQAAFPEGGSPPKELRSLGIQEYRQVFFKPYRVIYRIVGEQVVVYAIADGRRDMQTPLERRLLGA